MEKGKVYLYPYCNCEGWWKSIYCFLNHSASIKTQTSTMYQFIGQMWEASLNLHP